MTTTPFVEFTTLAAALPLLRTTAAPVTGDDTASRIDVVIDQDHDAGVTVARVYQDGAQLAADTAVHDDPNVLHPIIQFHVIDSGPFDDLQDHDWYAAALRKIRRAPDLVRTYIADRAREYHGPDDCVVCLTPPHSAPPARSYTLPPSRELDELDTSELENVHAAAADLIRARYTELVRTELRRLVADVRVGGHPVTRVVIPAQASYEGAPGEYDLTEITLHGQRGGHAEANYADDSELWRALAALADWRPVADGDPLQIHF